MSSKGISVPIVIEAAEIVGGLSKLAELLGVKRQTFYQWRQVPPMRVLAIEAATAGKIPRHRIRADLYPEGPGLENRDHAEAAA